MGIETVPESDYDLLAVLPDSASDELLDLANVWTRLRDLRRARVEVFPIRESEFEEARHIHGESSEFVAREGRLVYGH